MFRVGMKVTMKEKGVWARPYGEIVPVFGEVYTIRDIVTDADVHNTLRFIEIRNDCHLYLDGHREPSFNATVFSPVVDRKTDISVFEKLLNTKDEKELIRG